MSYPQIGVYRDGSLEPVDDENPLPVQLSTTDGNAPKIVTLGRLYIVEPFEVPGITAADALDALDMMGTKFSFAVPKAGVITKALWHDLDDEGINKQLWMFRADPGALPVSDAAFALTDVQNQQVVDVITFTTWMDGINNQVGKSSDLPMWYVAPSGVLWFAVQTAGADNIASGAMPRISLVIERYDDLVG